MEPILYIPNFIPKEEADHHFNEMQEIDWERRPDAPRSEHWSNDFNKPYTYGRGAGIRTYEAKPMPASVERIQEMILDATGVYHQGCFCNLYVAQWDWLGWHSDNDPGIDHSDPISVVTLGQARAIQYRLIGGGDMGEVMLEPGSLFIMKAGMQTTHQHRIPKAGHMVRTRISLTYRSLLRDR